MEENEYVRTDLGEIAIVTSVAKETLQDIMGNLERIGINEEIGFCNTEPYVRGNIIKHSKNIIDLIKLGDIVFTDDFNGYGFIHIYSTEMLEALKEDVKMEVKIKSILTKEQYEANCYKLEE